MKKLHDVMTQRTADLSLSGTGNLALIEGASVLGRINRRLYRQGRTYRMKVSLNQPLPAEAQDITYEVYTLRPTWMTIQTWRKAFEAYLNAHADELELAGKNAARWRDFRTKALGNLIGHLQCTPMCNTVTPAGTVTGVNLTGGEILSSDVETEASTGSKHQKTFCWMPTAGDLANMFDVCAEAENFTHTAADPSDADAGQMSLIPYGSLSKTFDDLSSAELENVVADGNEPPYDPENWLSNGPFVRVATLGLAIHDLGPVAGNAVIRNRMDTGFFDAPLGFVLIRDVTSSDQGVFTVEFAKGDYKGVQSHSLGKPIKTLDANRKYRVVDA